MRYDFDEINKANKKFSGRWIRSTTSGIGRIGHVEPMTADSDIWMVHFDIFVDTEHLSKLDWIKGDLIHNDRMETIDLYRLEEKRLNGENDVMYEFIDRRKAKSFINKARRSLLDAAGRLERIKV